MKKNIFVEGIQGSGKSTLLRRLYQNLEGYRIYLEGDISPVELAWCSYMTKEQFENALLQFPEMAEEMHKHTIKEAGEDGHYITEYTRILAEKREFYQYMEAFEIYNGRRTFEEFQSIILDRLKAFSGQGNLFECALFQNSMEELLLYYQKSDEEILDFYKQVYDKIQDKHIKLLYLHSDDIQRDVLQIKKERSDDNGEEMWFPLMLHYLNASPYGMEHEFHGIEDITAHLKRRMEMELRVIEEILGECTRILPAKKYKIEDVIQWVEE